MIGILRWPVLSRLFTKIFEATIVNGDPEIIRAAEKNELAVIAI